MSESNLQQTQEKPSLIGLLPWIAILAGCVIVTFYQFNRPGIEAPTINPPPGIQVEGDKEVSQRDKLRQRAEFFDDHVAHVVAKTLKENRLAAGRCVEKIEDLFDGYSEGTEPFVDEIMSFSSRWKTLKNMGRDWWYEDDSNSRMVSEMFQKHYFTEEKLQVALEGLLEDFRDEIQANQRAMLSDISISASQSGIPEITIPSHEQFSADVSNKLKTMSGKAATNSVTDGVTTFIASEVGSIAASQVVIQVLARFGTAAVVTTSAAGGGSVMVGGAAAGGGGGAVGGPLGVAVGVTVGIVVGIVIDYFMTKSSKAKLTRQMNDVLKNFKKTILDGNDDHPGISESLGAACNSYHESVKSTLYDSFMSNFEVNN